MIDKNIFDCFVSYFQVNVMVEDINNCEPTFSQDALHFDNVPETAAVGETVATGKYILMIYQLA